MARTTIDYGIDLGTTKSCISVINGTTTEVFRNNENMEFTPSAVWIDDKNKLYVGKRAKDRVEYDVENAFCEFKLQMGTSHVYTFSHNKRTMSPEDLSAEVLKSLKADVMQRAGENITAAVITVPAAFTTPMCEATIRAAKMAGLTVSPLLQEPVAASLAYGFQGSNERVFWLVYDFGGGTFDAALMSLQDGEIMIANHGGDNYLGGKLIDWAIVDQLFVPAIKKNYQMSTFERSNPKWRQAFAKLKIDAEEAKVSLSRDESVDVLRDYLCQDEAGMPVRFEFRLERAQLESIIDPFLERSINICKKVLSEKNMEPKNVQKMILVGGPTLTPYIRKVLSERLGIPMDFRIDPITVVSRGAAIFAGTQLMTNTDLPSAGKFKVELIYKPVDNETEPLVGGKIISHDGKPLTGYTIELVEEKSLWRSGKITLNDKGAFSTILKAEKGRKNEFRIELKDATGVLQVVEPATIPYTVGTSIGNPVLPHSVGVAMDDNKVFFFHNKGQKLPARKSQDFLTTTDVKRGASGVFIQIPVIEGESAARADRNRVIGVLMVKGDSVKRDVPGGSDIEITINIDESRHVTTTAYIPLLDEAYRDVVALSTAKVDIDRVTRELDEERNRLSGLKSRSSQVGSTEADGALQRIQRERIEDDVQTLLNAARGGDPDAIDKCENRLLDYKIAIDEVDAVFAWPAKVDDAHKAVDEARRLTDQIGNDTEKSTLDTLARDVDSAILARDGGVMEYKLAQIQRQCGQMLFRHPGFWVSWFNEMVEQRSSMSDQGRAEELIGRGVRSINNNDINGLKSVVRDLRSLLPASQQTDAPRNIGGMYQSGIALRR